MPRMTGPSACLLLRQSRPTTTLEGGDRGSGGKTRGGRTRAGLFQEPGSFSISILVKHSRYECAFMAYRTLASRMNNGSGYRKKSFRAARQMATIAGCLSLRSGLIA